jgi:hypothetical protein
MASAYLFLTQDGVTELLASWTQPVGEPVAVSKGLGKMFDSTHFKPTVTSGPNQAGPVIVTFLAYDSLGRPYPASYSVPVKNRALFGQYDFGPGQPVGAMTAMQRFQAIPNSLNTGRFSYKLRAGENFESPTWVNNEILGSNLIYVSSHGAPGLYATQLPPVTPTDHSRRVFAAIQTFTNNAHRYALDPAIGDYWSMCNGLDRFPPYNTSAVPPLNFIFLDTCVTFNGIFTDALYPWYSYVGGAFGQANQAAAGFRVFTLTDEADDIANTISDNISVGKPVARSVFEAVDVMRQAPYYVTVQLTNPGPRVPVEREDLAVQGDPYTKVVGLYTANDLIYPNWK